jgi:hypothetical protein
VVIVRVRPFPTFNSRCGAANLAIMAVGLALSAIAGVLLKKKSKSPIEDDKPTTLTTRGSYTNWFVGVRLVGPVFAWAGDREMVKEAATGGKGSKGPDVDVWYEAGWHLLGVGPCDELKTIRQGGKIIFDGPISRTSHPSGTTVDLGLEGAFVIYWGEVDQPINTFLGNPARVTISSRWGNTCYIQWTRKRLGQNPTWPKLDYELARRPSLALLTLSDSWHEPTAILSGVTADISGFLANANPDIGYLETKDDFTQELNPGQPMKLTGNSMLDGVYTVRRAVIVMVTIGTGYNGFPIKAARTHIFIEGGTLGANNSGTVEAYTFATDDGANIAHAIAELLFAPYPLGLSLDTGVPEPWDIASLEELGIEAETEGWLASLISVDGDTAEGLLAGAMLDHGFLIPFDTFNGYLTFQRIREPVGILPNITADLEGEDEPEIESYLGERPIDKMIFSFADRDHVYSDMTIGEDDDGQISYSEYARAKVLGMPSTVHFDTAAKLSELRAQEALAGAGLFKLKLARGVRLLIPGQAVVSDRFDEVLRVIGVTWDPLSDVCTLAAYPDFYGARKSDFVLAPGGGGPNLNQVALNLEGVFLEIPEQLLTVEQMFLLAPQIRAHAQISSSALHISRDDSTYAFKGSETGFAAGGLLDVALPASSLSYLATGPSFTVEGPDLGGVLDLSADPVNLGLGRQLVVISSDAGIEICFVEKITSLSGTQARLDGLLRARYDTRKLDHPIDAAVFIFQNTTLTNITDVLLVPAEDLFLKAQPVSGAGVMPLSNVPPFGALLRGKGLVPINPEYLHTVIPFMGVPVWRTGDDVTVTWAWSSAFSKNTGAGFQNSGVAIADPTLKGSFFVELLTSGGTVVNTQNVTVDEVSYLTATLAAAPISNGTFKVRVTHQYNGYSSDPITLTVTHI